MKTDRLKEIRIQMKVEEATGDDDIVSMIRERCPFPDKLKVFPLKDNLETVISTIGLCDHGNSISKEWFAKALSKRMNERDLIFRKTSREEYQAIRDCVLRKMEALSQTVDEVIQLLQE